MLGFHVCAIVLSQTILIQQYTFGKVILFTQYIHSNGGKMVYLKLFFRISFYCNSMLHFIDGNLILKVNGHLQMVMNAYVSNWEAKAAGLGV